MPTLSFVCWVHVLLKKLTTSTTVTLAPPPPLNRPRADGHWYATL